MVVTIRVVYLINPTHFIGDIMDQMRMNALLEVYKLLNFKKLICEHDYLEDNVAENLLNLIDEALNSRLDFLGVMEAIA